MEKTYHLTTEAIAAIMASPAVQSLPQEDADCVNEALHDSLGGGNVIDRKTARLRVDRILALVDPGNRTGLRVELIEALGL